MKRFYKLIATTSDLYALQMEAAKFDKVAVGVSKAGYLYKIDDTKKAVTISEVEAAELLETSIENIRNIIETEGAFVINDNQSEEEALATETEDNFESESEAEVEHCDCSCTIELEEEIRNLKEELAEKDKVLNDLKKEHNELYIKNVELETAAKKEPPLTLEKVIEYVKKNGYELTIK